MTMAMASKMANFGRLFRSTYNIFASIWKCWIKPWFQWLWPCRSRCRATEARRGCGWQRSEKPRWRNCCGKLPTHWGRNPWWKCSPVGRWSSRSESSSYPGPALSWASTVRWWLQVNTLGKEGHECFWGINPFNLNKIYVRSPLLIESSPMGDMSKTEGFHGFPSQKKSRIPLRVKAQNATGNKVDDEGTTGLVTNAFFLLTLSWWNKEKMTSCLILSCCISS